AYVLADTRASADSDEARANRASLTARTEELNSAQAAIENMMPRMLAPGLRAGSLPDVLTRSMMAGTAPRTVSDGARGLAARPDSLSLLASIDVPVLIVVGEHDLLTPPSDSEAMLERLPNARLERIDQAGHMANLENPEHFNQVVLEWLSSIGDR